MRVAVLPGDNDAQTPAFLSGLASEGLDVRVLAPQAPALAGRALEKRGFAPALAALPASLLALRRDRHDVVVACSPIAAAPALMLRDRCPILVIAVDTPPDRASFGARRLELQALTASLERCAALVVPDEPTAAAVRRWLACDPVVTPDAPAVAALLRSVSK